MGYPTIDVSRVTTHYIQRLYFVIIILTIIIVKVGSLALKLA